MGSYKTIYFRNNILLHWLDTKAHERGISLSSFVCAILEAYYDHVQQSQVQTQTPAPIGKEP